MKNESITRINKMGKACRIIATVLKVCTIIGIVCISLCICFFGAYPLQDIKLTGDVNGQIHVNVDDLPFNSSMAGWTLESDSNKIKFTKDNEMVYNDIFVMKLDEIKTDDNTLSFGVSSDLSDIDFKIVKIKGIVRLILTDMILIAGLVVSIFTKKLAKSIETCDTPFCEEVIKNMKSFGYSLIPLAMLGGINGSLVETALITLGIIIIINVFSYGTKLQQESDETL